MLIPDNLPFHWLLATVTVRTQEQDRSDMQVCFYELDKEIHFKDATKRTVQLISVNNYL